ncbi:MAG: LD-carboxypeptidase [Lewinellaceae bacterium]|nr:LD-carboxypeptidase [Lewinellaceae bacterium]
MAAAVTGFSLKESMAKSLLESPVSPIRPRRLRQGATVALIAPASPFSDEKLERARNNIAGMGFVLREGDNLHARYGYLAGTDAQRLDDLHAAFRDPGIDAIWCIRGGYGCSRLLPQIDYKLIELNPKPLIGYSDITALHLAVQQRTGLITFHGPVAAAEFPDDTLRHFQAVLTDPQAEYRLQIPAGDAELPHEMFRPYVIHPGKARGTITGGNLSLLAALIGTDFEPSFRGKLVFIEDVGEQPYRIDRMLTQMLQATDLAKAAGIALGVFAGCEAKDDSPSLSLRETLEDRLSGLGIPVVYGIPFGHVEHQATLPYGIKAELDADAGTLTLLEMAVRD